MFKFKKLAGSEEKVSSRDDKIKFTKESPVEDNSVNEELKRVAALASECLEHASFKKYAESLLKIEETLINELIIDATQFEYSGKSMESFGARVLSKLIKLSSIKSLLLSVRKDIARGSAISDEKGKEE